MSINLNNFLKIKPTITDLKTPAEKFNINTTAIFGKNEPIFKMQDQRAMLEQFFDNLKIIEQEHTAHYPHIDAPEETFIPLLS